MIFGKHFWLQKWSNSKNKIDSNKSTTYVHVLFWSNKNMKNSWNEINQKKTIFKKFFPNNFSLNIPFIKCQKQESNLTWKVIDLFTSEGTKKILLATTITTNTKVLAKSQYFQGKVYWQVVDFFWTEMVWPRRVEVFLFFEKFGQKLILSEFYHQRETWNSNLNFYTCESHTPTYK